MYPALLNQNPPAPYAMSPSMTPQAAPQVPTYAHGGRAKRGKMVIAHMNPKELHVLDHIQGKIERCPKSGMRSYSHLEELLKNPHILANVHHHAREHHAMGEEAGDHHDYHDEHLNHLAAGGMHGDSELALIGPHTHHVFNQLADGLTTNPHDGHPQYFSLRSALGGIWNTIKGGANKAGDYLRNNGRDIIGSAGKTLLPSLMPGLQKTVANNLGPIGGMVSGALPGLAKTGLDKLAGPGAASNPYGNIAGQALAAANDARNAGSDWRQSLGHGLGRAGQRISETGVGPGGLGRAMRGTGDSLAGGSGIRDALSGGLNKVGGTDAIKKAAMDMMQKRISGAPEGNPYEGMAGMF
jgi:hypothetical protein